MGLVLNTATDKIQLKGFLAIGKVLSEMKKAGGLNTGLKLSQEYSAQLGQELIQNAIEPTVETAASKFRIGMEQKSLKDEVVAFVDTVPTTASATLWLTLVGEGAYSVREWAGGKRKVADRLREAGAPTRGISRGRF